MTVSLKEIKEELSKKSKSEVLAYCVRLSNFKKENKELLHFLLFQKDDLTSFIDQINAETLAAFESLNVSNVYFIKKGVRKILRDLNKKNRFALDAQVEAESLIYFCYCMKSFKIPMKKSVQLQNIYQSQIKKIEKSIQKLHPDLQFDLLQKLEK